jgi:dihydroorotase
VHGVAGRDNAEAVIDASGLCVTPGFVDLHTHLRFPGFTAKETIASGTAAAVRGGFTTICAMANALPAVDSAAQVERVRLMVESEAKCRVEIVGAVTRGLAGYEATDVGELIAAGVIAISDDGNPIVDASCMADALSSTESVGLPISAHEEMRTEDHGSRWPCEDEVDMIRRDLALLRRHGGRLHIAHISCRESVELVAEAQAQGLEVTAEVTPHHLALTKDIWEGDERLPPDHPATKVNPPLRSPLDVEAVQTALASGIIAAVATDHAPHCGVDKAGDYDGAAFGMIGLELALPILLEMVSIGSISLSNAVARLTIGPAELFCLKAGTLETGSAADVCIFDPNEQWQASRDTVVSKGKNSPMMRKTFTGRVKTTIVDGTIFHFGRDHELRALRAF